MSGLLTTSVLQVSSGRVFFLITYPNLRQSLKSPNTVLKQTHSINGVLVHVLQHELFGTVIHESSYECRQVQSGGSIKLKDDSFVCLACIGRYDRLSTARTHLEFVMDQLVGSVSRHGLLEHLILSDEASIA